MKKITFFYSTILFIVFNVNSIAQTKLIHHKSHSGSLISFKMAYKKNLFDIGESNFGMAPISIVKNAELDSLIFLNDSTTIMVTSEYCEDSFRPNKPPKRPRSSPDYNYLDTDTSTFWRPGKVIVQNHPDFNRKNPVDSIKKKLREKYYFVNAPESVVFIDSSINKKGGTSENYEQIKEEVNQNRNHIKPNNNIFKEIWITVAIIIVSTLSTGLFNRW